ncbi:MAG: RND transporter [Propionibacteriales bacterium]|nr:RND transporter [Propionibacteriales bacterium]
MTDERGAGGVGARTATTRARAALAVFALIGFGAVIVLGLARLEIRTSLDSFLPADDPQLEQYQALGEDFGAEPIVILVETGERTDPVLKTDRMPDLVRLEGELAALPGVTSVYGPGTTLNQIAGRAKDLLSELVGRRDAEIALAESTARDRGAPAAQVRRAGDDARVRFDARYGPLLVSGMDGGLPTLGNQRFIDAVVYAADGGSRAQWQFVVPRPQSVAILVRPAADLDAGGLARLVDKVNATVDGRRPAGTTTTVTGTAVIVAALSDRAMADAPLLGVLAVAGLTFCFAAAVWIRRRLRLLPIALTLVSLAVSLSVFGWAGRPVTLGMVAFGSVLLGLGSYYPTYALTGASRRTVAVVGTASAASLATLALSPMPLVRDIGLLLGVGVTVCLALTLATSALLKGTSNAMSAAGAVGDANRGGLNTTTLRVFALLGIVLAAWGWQVLPDIPVAAEVEHFAGGLSALDDARHAEDVLGSSGEIDVVLSGVDTLTPEALAWMNRAEDVIARGHGDVMQAVLSPATFLDFLGAEPTQDQVEAAVRLLPEYLAGSVIAPDRSQALMTYGVRLDDVSGLANLRTELIKELPVPPAGYEVQLVGLPLVLVQGQEVLSQDRYDASLIGIAVAAAVLLLGLRRRADALRAVLAALVATGWGFLLLDLSGRGFDPVTIALGTLTVAVGAEFTVVLAEAARRASRTLTRTVALMAAASAVGYLVLLGSGLAAVRTFGAELALGVGFAFAAASLVVAATTRPVRPSVPEADPVEEPAVEAPRKLEAVHA